jgi:hypothetical protein
MTPKKPINPNRFFSKLNWLDGKPLVIEPYRQRIFSEALYTFGDDGNPYFNLVLCGRAKKNWKSADLILTMLYRLLAWKSQAGNQCYVLANDEDQAGDDLQLAKKVIAANPILKEALTIKQKIIERKDAEGFCEILPAGDVVGSHGKTYLFLGLDEIHGYRTWDIIESLQPDPTRLDALMWITSYASIYHRPGVPLFDLFAAGKKGEDPKMYLSWYASDYTTDPALENESGEDKANPSRSSWNNPGYLAQQRRRLPSHKYRRLHLNLPGAPEGAAFSAEKIVDSIERDVKVRPFVPGTNYFFFFDGSVGTHDYEVLTVGHRDEAGRAVLDLIVDQARKPPFDPLKTIPVFAEIVRQYGGGRVVGDRLAFNIFENAWAEEKITYVMSDLTAHQLYEQAQVLFNTGQAVLLDDPTLESEFLGLVWRGGKIDHVPGEFDDHSNSASGALYLATQEIGNQELIGYGERVKPDWGGMDDYSAYRTGRLVPDW